MTRACGSGRVDCRQIEALLPPYVDGAGSQIERARVASHLERCPGCRQVAEAQRAVRQLLRARHTGLCGQAPPALTAHLRAAASAGAPLLGWRGRLSALAAAGVVVLAVVGAFAWTTGRSSALLAAQLTLDHIKCFMIDGDDHAEHLTADGAETRMLQAFGWSVPIPQPAARAEVHLVAVRRCLYGEGMIAHVLYRIGGAPVSLFVMPRTRATDGDVSAFGRHAEVIHRDGMSYVLVAPAELHGVAAAVGLEAE
jgi:anti-sigma factor RsiW